MASADAEDGRSMSRTIAPRAVGAPRIIDGATLLDRTKGIVVRHVASGCHG